MPFAREPKKYQKTIPSDLQDAWSLLRYSVIETAGFENLDRAICHIDKAMSWETVRNLRMPPLLQIIRNMCIQGKAQVEALENNHELDNIQKEAFSEFLKGKKEVMP